MSRADQIDWKIRLTIWAVFVLGVCSGVSLNCDLLNVHVGDATKAATIIVDWMTGPLGIVVAAIMATMVGLCVLSGR